MKQKLRYIGKFVFHYLVSPLVPYIPFPVLRRMGVILGNLNYLISTGQKDQIESNLRMTFPEKSEIEIKGICRDNFINHAMHSLEILYLPRVDKRFIEKHVRLEGFENYEKAARRGKGIIIALGHIGFYFLSGVSLDLLGELPLNDISQDTSKLKMGDLDRKILERRLANYQSRISGKIFHRGGSLLGLIKAIKRNEAVSLFLDAFTTEKDPIVNLLGKRARVPQGPIRMAMQAGAAIVFTTAIRQSNGEMVFALYEPLELVNTGDREKDLQVNCQKYIDLLESVIRKHPDQWHLWRLWHERHFSEVFADSSIH